MNKKIIKLDDTEIEEYKFHQYKSPFLISDKDINKLVVSKKFPFGKQNFKCFISYKDLEKIRRLCIFRPQMITYKGNFDESMCIYCLVKEKEIFTKYMKILEKVSNIIKSKYISELMCSKKDLNTKKKRNHKRRFPILNGPIKLIGSIYRKGENYYPKVFLEKYYFIEEIEIFCSNSDKKFYDEKCINLFLETLKK